MVLCNTNDLYIKFVVVPSLFYFYFSPPFLYNMVDTKQRTTLKKLARWTPSTTTSRNQFVQPLSQEAPFTIVPHDKLQQGGLYILKIKQVSLALFEGMYTKLG